ncbi:hypothetical protein GCM10027421_13260 [Microbacterium shaanxiense]
MDRRHATYRRVLRRETHASRSAAAVIFAVLFALMLLGALALGVWAVVDRAFRERAAAWISDVVRAADATSVLIVTGILCLLVAVLLILAAVLPGRRARHARVTDRVALLIDDGVLADAAADAVAREHDIDRRQISTTIARRSLSVRVTPTSGIRIDPDRVAKTASVAVADAGFDTAASVDIARAGVIA